MTKKDKKMIKQRDFAMAIRHDRSTPDLPQLGLDVALMSPLPTSSLIDHHHTPTGSGSAVSAAVTLQGLARCRGTRDGLQKLLQIPSRWSWWSYACDFLALSCSLRLPALLRWL
jgi:hypothetical protein